MEFEYTGLHEAFGCFRVSDDGTDLIVPLMTLDWGSKHISYHGIQLMGIAIVAASLAVGAGQTYLSANATGFFGYTPNAVVAIIGVIVAIIGGIVDPMIDNWLQRSSQLGQPGKERT